MELVSYLTDSRVIMFLLLFVRLTALLAFLPFFSALTIPINVKGALAFYFTLLFYPLLPLQEVPTETSGLILAILSEATMGLVVGFVLEFVFSYFRSAGEHISTTMGFSMASQLDPQTMQSSPLMSQFLAFFTLMVFLALDAHHHTLTMVAETVKQLPLGTFVLHNDWQNYLFTAMKSLFLTGFVIAFPIVALSLLSDLIFGMIMKTMPQFNLLVIGFPVKILVSLAVITAVLGSYVVIFEREWKLAMGALNKLLF